MQSKAMLAGYNLNNAAETSLYLAPPTFGTRLKNMV
jgi:hypothetical protein